VTRFQVALLLATFLQSLAAGFLFAFAAVVMPGLRSLDAAAFIRAFQAIDRVIKENQPLFLVVWVGSVLALIAAAVLGLSALRGTDRAILIVATLVYLVGVQLPTAAINIPLNNALHQLTPDTMDESTRARARQDFEPRWNRWNIVRTACAALSTGLLILLLTRM
jgi:uncharacterized membrane protein